MRTVLHRPVQQPLPIWMMVDFNLARPALQTQAMRRVATYDNGWMTDVGTPKTVAAGIQTVQQFKQVTTEVLPLLR